MKANPVTRHDLRWVVGEALRAYRVEVERCLLGVAYARQPTSQRPALDEAGTARAREDHPMAYASTCGLPDPGSWDGVWRALWHSPLARQLRALDLDPGVVALAEMIRVERTAVGPESGVLRARQHTSPAWRAMYAQARLHKAAPPWRRIDAQLLRHQAQLSPAVTGLWDNLYTRLLEQSASEGVTLALLPLPASSVTGRFTSKNPLPISRAPGWAVQASIDIDIDSDIDSDSDSDSDTDSNNSDNDSDSDNSDPRAQWSVTVQSVWLGRADEPSAAPIVNLFVGDRTEEREQMSRWTLPLEREPASLEGRRRLRGTVMMWAELAEDQPIP